MGGSVWKKTRGRTNHPWRQRSQNIRGEGITPFRILIDWREFLRSDQPRKARPVDVTSVISKSFGSGQGAGKRERRVVRWRHESGSFPPPGLTLRSRSRDVAVEGA